MIIRSLPNVYLQYAPTFNFLRLEWVAQSDPHLLRISAQQLLDLLAELDVRHLLLDMNSMPNLPQADQMWLGEHWMPGLLTLELEQLLLVIDGAQVHNQLVIDSLYSLVQHEIRFAPHYFSDTLSAQDWLTDGSPELPALLAEWEAGKLAL